MIGLALTVGGVIAAEVGLRVFFGLGRPMLFVTDPQIEYMSGPGSYSRFGNTITINSRHMRATPESNLTRAASSQRRVLVLGDSIIHGGNQTDDRDLATVLLELMLPTGVTSESSPVQSAVVNVSCGSWGPGNVLAYVKHFGTFDCDTAVLVLNSWDYGDVPSFTPLSPEMPSEAPGLALIEIKRNYGPRYAPWIFGRPTWGPEVASAAGISEAEPTEELGAQSLASLRELIALLRSKNLKVAAVLHPFRRELIGGIFDMGRGKLTAELVASNVPILTTDGPIKQMIDLAASPKAGKSPLPAGVKLTDPYRDDIHLTAAGQWVLAGVLKDAAAAATGGTPSQ